MVVMADWQLIFYIYFSYLSSLQIPRLSFLAINNVNKGPIAGFRNNPSHEMATNRLAVKEIEQIYGTDVIQCNENKNTFRCFGHN